MAARVCFEPVHYTRLVEKTHSDHLAFLVCFLPLAGLSLRELCDSLDIL